MASAQESTQSETHMRQILSQAESDYRIGRIEQARDALLQELSNFRGNQKQNALRLIALGRWPMVCSRDSPEASV